MRSPFSFLPSRKIRLPLFHERTWTLSCIGGAHDVLRALFLDCEGVFERPAARADDRLLDLADGERTVLGDASGELVRAVEQLLARHDLVDETDLERGRCRQWVAGE